MGIKAWRARAREKKAFAMERAIVRDAIALCRRRYQELSTSLWKIDIDVRVAGGSRAQIDAARAYATELAVKYAHLESKLLELVARSRTSREIVDKFSELSPDIDDLRHDELELKLAVQLPTRRA